MLRKFSFCIVFILCLICCNGQNYSGLIMQQIDSLDRIQPITLKKVRQKGRTSVIIENQKQFNDINNQITKSINAGAKNIKVIIRPGLYHFKEYHILREDENADDISITIEGENAVLTSSENDFTYDIDNSWGAIVRADSLIDVINPAQKLCFIPYRNNFNKGLTSNITKVQITQMYRAVVYDVQRIDNSGVYFVATDLSYSDEFSRKGYSVNYDYLYKGEVPRFRLFDESKYGQNNASRFLVIVNSSYKSLSIRGLDFISNKEGAALFMTDMVHTNSFIISKCSFKNIRSSVGIFGGTNNIIVDDNIISETRGNELIFLRGCREIRVTNNIFEKCGQSMDQTFCINCGEAAYYIANNTFRDFGYAAIGVGVSYLQNKNFYTGGIIEYNEFYYTPTYIAHKDKHTLMDSGAIYAWTQNDDVIIRYNYIHDYEGAGDNRGIFCDDGACNIKIYGNIVLNTPDGYSIDSRYVKDQRYGLKNNSNNFIAFNVVDNKVRFMGCETERRHCVKGANFIISEEPITKNKFSCLDLQVDDINAKGGFNYRRFKRLDCKKYIQKLINNN